jgi:hypothetical protein
MKLRYLAVFTLVLALLVGCHKKPEEEKPAVPEQKVAKKVVTPEKRAVPKPSAPGMDHLFTITRSQNRNQVIYEAHRAGSGFDTQDPINIYWIMVEKGGTTEGLTSLEKKSAYGVSVVSATKDKVVFNLKALEDRKIEVTYDEKGKKSVALMPINGQPAELESVYINATPGKLIPKVLNIDITGRSVASGNEVKEVIKP